MKLWFRLPESDQEDELARPAEPPELPSVESARGAAFVGVGVVLACQILHPVALPYLLIFGASGAAAGTLFALEDREAAGLGLVGLWFIEEIFSSPDLLWVVCTAVVTGGAVLIAFGVGSLIRRAWEVRHGG